MTNRLHSALVQKLYFIEENTISKNKREYMIMGSTGNVYTVTIAEISTCSCPDYLKRKIRCKHIYFVLARVLKVAPNLIETKKYNASDLTTLFLKLSLEADLVIPTDKKKKYNYLTNHSVKDVVSRKEDNDICPICLDDIVNLKLAYYCKNSCGKNVHIECFDMWTRKKGSKCVFCNANWFDKDDDKKTYINLT